MYWLGFGHGVIVACFVGFVVVALTGTFCIRWIGRLAAANRARVRAAEAPFKQRPPVAPPTSAPGRRRPDWNGPQDDM